MVKNKLTKIYINWNQNIQFSIFEWRIMHVLKHEMRR